MRGNWQRPSRKKTGRARAVSLLALLDAASDGSTDPADNSEQELRWELARVFRDLPENYQSMLLVYRWDDIASEEMRGVLREISESAPDAQKEVRGAALRRLHELEPPLAREMVLEEMRREPPRVSAKALSALTDDVLPEMDELLVERLTAEGTVTLDWAAELLARYGSEAVLEPVRAFYETHEGTLACRAQAALVAYFLRVAPEEGLARVRSAVSRRGDPYTHCYASLLRDVTRLRKEAALEEIAIELLRDPDPEVISNAAAWLGQNGSADAEAILWKRLEDWSRQWQDRELELLDAFEERRGQHWEGRIEAAVMEALRTSQAWQLDVVKRRRMAQLCVTPQCREQFQ